MSFKNVKDGKTQKQAETTIRHEQKNFGLMKNDLPATEIDAIDLFYRKNLISYPTHNEVRTGSKLWSDTNLPALRTGITASRTGGVVTKTVGANFAGADVYGNYFVWADGDNDEIVGYTDANNITTRQTADKTVQAGCWIHGSVYATIFHQRYKKVVIHIDTRFFVADYGISGWTEIEGLSYQVPTITRTQFHFQEDYIIAINGGNVFKINIGVAAPYYYLINSEIPQEQITAVAKSDVLIYGRRYIYSMVRFQGNNYLGMRVGNNESPLTARLIIEQESGTVAPNSEKIDYGEVFTELPVGVGNETHGVLTCDTAATGFPTIPDAWRVLADATPGGFCINMNGLGVKEVICDCGNVFCVDDIRFVIEYALRGYYPSAKVTVEPIPGTLVSRFVIDSGKLNGNTVSFLTPPTTALVVDISGVGWLRGTAALATLNNATQYTAPSAIGSPVVSPIDINSPAIMQTHPTHFAMWGTRDSGVNGTDPITGQGNNPEYYYWLSDIPVMKAFTAHRIVGTNVLVADTGLFIESDMGNTLTFIGGLQAVPLYLCDAAGTRVYTHTSQFAYTTPNFVIAINSATFGAAEILTCTKAGYTVTLVAGFTTGGVPWTFSAADVKKPLFWADGTISWITDFIDANNVTVMDFGAKVSQGVAINPATTGRIFNDTISDETLKARSNYAEFNCYHRFYTKLPSCDIGVIVPGFLVVCKRGESMIYFSPINPSKSYLMGYYNAAFQWDNKCEDKIQRLRRFPDRLIAYCANSTWGTDTNRSLEDIVPNTNIPVALLGNLNLIANIGLTHVGSVQTVDIGRDILLTSEPAVRIFDGFQYSANLAENQVIKRLKGISIFVTSHYDPIGGYILWGAEEEL